MVGYADGVYCSTSKLDVLREDAPVSLKAMAIAQGAPGHWLPWGSFPDSVMTGEAQSKAALGHTHFDYYARNPEEAGQFIQAMQGTSELVQGEVVRLLDIKGAETAVDVGGANGALLCALAKVYPGLKGVVYDLPHSRDGGLAYIAKQGLSDRLGVECGDFFAAAPVADLYLLKFILHDWDDPSAVRILTNIRGAMKAGGRVVLVEMRLGDVGEAGLGPLVDVNMMAVTGGRERTRDEYQKVLAAANLKLDQSDANAITIRYLRGRGCLAAVSAATFHWRRPAGAATRHCSRRSRPIMIDAGHQRQHRHGARFHRSSPSADQAVRVIGSSDHFQRPNAFGRKLKGFGDFDEAGMLAITKPSNIDHTSQALCGKLLFCSAGVCSKILNREDLVRHVRLLRYSEQAQNSGLSSAFDPNETMI